MSTLPVQFDGYAEDDAKYEAFVHEIESLYPRCDTPGFDFSQIRGKSDARTMRACVLHLALTGMPVAEIAEKLGFETQLVSRYLHEAIRQAKPDEAFEDVLLLELAKLDAQAKEAWRCHERSCEDEVTKTTTFDDEGKETTQVKRKGQSGNPAWQKVLLDIGKRRDALLGLEAPKKTEITKNQKTLHISEVIVHTRADVEEARKAGLLK